MASRGASLAYPHGTQGEVKVIVYDKELSRFGFEKPQRFEHRQTRPVDISGRFYKKSVVSAGNGTILELRRQPLAGYIQPFRQTIDNIETEIVSCMFVARARIPQPSDNSGHRDTSYVRSSAGSQFTLNTLKVKGNLGILPFIANCPKG